MVDLSKIWFGNIDLPEGAAEQLGLNLPGDNEQSEGSEDKGKAREAKNEEEDVSGVELSGEDAESGEDESMEDDTHKQAAGTEQDRSMTSMKEETDSRPLPPGGMYGDMNTDMPVADLKKETTREYKFGIVGKEPNGEIIYKLSELYVPEDQHLKARIVAYNKRNLMSIRENTMATAESKLKRKQKSKEIHQKLSNYYKQHKPRVLDEMDVWLPASTDHIYRRRIQENPNIVNLKEEQQPPEQRNRLSSLSFDMTHYKADAQTKPHEGPAPATQGTEAIHIHNWIGDVMENIKRSANRYHAEKIQEETEDTAAELRRQQLSAASMDETYLFQNQDRPYERRSPLIRPKRAPASEDPMHDVLALLEETQPDAHWGSVRGVETAHTSYRKIKKLHDNMAPIFSVQRDIEAEEKGELPIEMINLKEIRRFQPINKEVTTANWINAVLLKPFAQADERAKAQYRRYLAELPHPLQFSQVHPIEENFDTIYQRMQQKAERKDSFVRSTMPGTQGGYMRPRSTSFGLQGSDAQGDQKEGHGEITSLHTRVTKSKILKVMHSKVVYRLRYNKLSWDERSLDNFHRPRLLDPTCISLMRKGKDWHRHKVDSEVWIAKLIRSEAAMNEEEGKLGKDETQEIINAHDFFKNRTKLSIRNGKFCLMEHVDEHPFFINNFGMASKMIRYLYESSDPAGKPKEPHIGPYGIEIRLSPKDKLPLLGQLDLTQHKGIAILENNMYYAPIFYRSQPREEFLLIRHKKKDKKSKEGRYFYTLREIHVMYTMGQIEPKTEVFNPQSRQYNSFVKERAQKYVYNVLKIRQGTVNFTELHSLFSRDFNDQIFKKFLKEIKVEEDRNHDCFRTDLEENFQIKELPEKICRYESAQAAHNRLIKCGIRNLVSADKITYATNKYISEEEDSKKRQIAKFVEEELLCTPWHLTQSFMHSKDSKGMMMLRGVGDPSNGQGGYSYLKKPMKLSSTDNRRKMAQTELDMQKQRNAQKIGSVTGTDADLRKLDKEKLKKHLLELGYKEEEINKKRRWERVDLLRKHSTQAELSGIEGDFQKFSRVRITTEMQKKDYQKTANSIFAKQIEILSLETIPAHLLAPQPLAPKPPPSLPPVEALKFDSGKVPQGEVPRKYKRIEFSFQHSAKNLNELPGLLIQKDAKTVKIEVLKKTIKVFDREHGVERIKTAYITDPKQIKQFKKRKSKKEVREAKRKGGPPKKKRANSPAYHTDESSFPEPTSGKMIIKIQQSSVASQEDEKEKPPIPEEPMTIKLDLTSLKSNKMEYIQEMVKPKVSGSRKRQNNPEKQFNEALEEIIDKCMTADSLKAFGQPVKKKDAPDYYHKILYPMDLGTMKNKARRWEYYTVDGFKNDVELVRSNAEKYNGITSYLADQARGIERIAFENLVKSEQTLKSLEERIRKEKEGIAQAKDSIMTMSRPNHVVLCPSTPYQRFPANYINSDQR